MPACDYSCAEALAVRGHYDDAIAAYQEAIDEVLSDPEPYLRIARLLTDKVSDPEKVAVWLQRAIQETELPGSSEMVLVRELTEFYRHRIERRPYSRGSSSGMRVAQMANGPERRWLR